MSTQAIQIEEEEIRVIRSLFSEIQDETIYGNSRRVFQWFKRIFDVVVSIILILCSIILFPFIGLAIKLSSPGPIFFKQLRTGFQGKDFFCLKFRTMHVNKEAHTLQAKEKDPRITRVGTFLRNTHLDELPQFFNVLKGDMSLVGPRPHMVYHTKQFSKMFPFYHLRHNTRPGISGMAQVKGFVGEIQVERDIRKRVQWDIYYLNHQSIGLDLNIMLHTIKAFFQRLF